VAAQQRAAGYMSVILDSSPPHKKPKQGGEYAEAAAETVAGGGKGPKGGGGGGRNRAKEIGELASVISFRERTTRPDITECTEEEFLKDHQLFSEMTGLCAANNSKIHGDPVDIFTMYKMVCYQGGYYGYGDGINWAGQIFPAMKNYRVGHKQTGIGNQLKVLYTKCLLNYELAHPDDIDSDSCKICKTLEGDGNWIACAKCDGWFHYGCITARSEVARRPKCPEAQIYAFYRHRKQNGPEYTCTPCLLAARRGVGGPQLVSAAAAASARAASKPARVTPGGGGQPQRKSFGEIGKKESPPQYRPPQQQQQNPPSSRPAGDASEGSRRGSEDGQEHKGSRGVSVEPVSQPGRVVSTTVHIHSTSATSKTTTTTTTTSSTRLLPTWRGGAGKSRLAGHTEGGGGQSAAAAANSTPKWPPPWRGTAKTSRLIKAKRIETAAKGRKASRASSPTLNSHPDLPSKSATAAVNSDYGNMTLQSQSPKARRVN